MPDKNDPRARLVAEAFHDEWTTGPASAFARAAAAHARRRRAVRRVLAATATVSVIVFAFFTYSSRQIAPTEPSPVLPVAPTLASKVSPAFEIISDEELFATLKTRPLLVLPDEPVDRRYVVLNHADAFVARP